MGTKDFNALDLLICRWRSRVVRHHIRPDSVALDFGCGHQALFLRTIAGKIRRGIGIDYDADPGRIAANIEIRQTHFRDRLDFPDRSFDQISLLAVLEHIPLDQVDVLFREFRRLIRDDGIVLITTPTPLAKPVLEFMAFRLKIISEAEIADHRHYWSAADLRALAARHGLVCRTYYRFLLGMNCFTAFSPLPSPITKHSSVQT